MPQNKPLASGGRGLQHPFIVRIAASHRRAHHDAGLIVLPNLLLTSFAVDAISNVSPNTSITMEEFEGANREMALFLPNCLYLPYGSHHEADGSEALFSRDTKPLWRLRPGKMPERLNPWEKFNAGSKSCLPDGREAPRMSKLDLTDEHKYLASRGVIGLPKLANALPDLILKDQLRTNRDAVDYMHEQYQQLSVRNHHRQ